MKQLLAIAIVVFMPLAVFAGNKHDNDDKTSNDNKHMRFVNDGAFAAISADTDPLSNFRLNVSRGTTNSGTTTNLTFFSAVFAADQSSATFVSIVGPIPNSAFTGDNTKDLTLNFDTSMLDPNTDFSQTCTADFTQVDPVFSCGPLPAGTIQLAFHENGVQRTRLFQVSISNQGPLTVFSHERSDNGSANVQGSILGNFVSSSSATVGVNFGTTVDITKK